ncbi:MAG TPA: SDR family oxidoreductase [Vicinamibacterales bacterium]|nr:SDR family oxidoreductase [Vicinamibacterales bacterium]
MTLSDRVVLITGAKRLGHAVAVAVAGRGADVAVTYNRSRAEADETVAAVHAAGRRAIAIRADVSDEAACASVIGEVEREYGRLDALVNMASLYQSVPFDSLTPAEWNRQLSVDLGGTFNMTHAAVPLLRRAGQGRVVNFCDWVAASGRPRYTGYVAYYVAKSGVKALTEVLALELARDQILVNAIAPGPILAPPGTSDEESDAVVRATPLGRWGGVDEIVKAVLALIETDFITGETIRVDGGRHLN